jgi:PKD repeat protein
MNRNKNIALLVVFSVVVISSLFTGQCKKGPYTPGENDVISVSVSPGTIAPGESAIITVTGVSNGGKAMPDNTLVQLIPDSGKIVNEKGETVQAVLLQNGKASATYVSDPDFTGETITVTITSGSALIVPESLVITLRDIDISQLFITANPLNLDSGGGTSTITVSALNSSMDAVPGKKIWLETTSGTLTPASPLTTGQDGKVIALLQTEEAATITATYKEVTRTIDITVGENAAPTAVFVFSPTEPVVDQDIVFNGTGSTDEDGSVVKYKWNFGDGVNYQSGSVVTHSYGAEGTYMVTLQVTDNDGATGVLSQEVAVGVTDNVVPTAAFTFSPTNPLSGDTVRFLSTESTDEDGSIVAYYWDFGDGDINDRLANPTHVYSVTVETTFTVTLTVTDNDGGQGSVSQEITVTPSLVAAFTFEALGNLTIAFDASSSTGDIDTYTWNFGDGTESGPRKVATTAHTYDTAKKYTVTLIITGTDGTEVWLSHIVDVKDD